MNKYKYVFFDLDGTLADTDLLVVESYLQLFKKYYPQQKVDFRLLTSFSGPSLKDTITAHFPHEDCQKLIEEFKCISVPLYSVFASLYDDILLLLQEFKKRNIKTAIITSKLRSATTVTMNILGLNDYIDYVVCLDDVTKPKPDPMGMNAAIAFFNANKKEVLYVGDAYTDLLTAQNAGVDCALVSWNIRGHLNCQPQYYVNNVQELIEVITCE